MTTDLITPEGIVEGAAAANTAIKTLRNLFALFREAKDLLPEGRKEAATKAIEEAEKQLKIAEAQLAGSMGYHLCKCEFPPNIMLLAGHYRSNNAGRNAGDPVYKCTKCNATTAGIFSYIPLSK